MSPREPFGKVLGPPAAATEGPHADLAAATASQLADDIRRRKVSSREATDAYLERIGALDPGVNAYITVAEERARAEASRLDDLLRETGPCGPLHGVPIAVKDNVDTAGIRTTGGTSLLRDWVPRNDARAVHLLRRAGAVVLGKTNLHEAAFGITSTNPHYGPVRNPYDPARIPGGSSGGSGVAVAARLCAAALGTDTGGSVRIPAALCGCVGLKPTTGLVSTHGVVSLSGTCDVVGPITRSVEDCALLLDVLAERGLPHGPPSPAGDPTVLKGLRIGLPDGYFATGNDPEVDRVLADALALFAGAGAEIVEVSVAGVDEANAVGFAIVVPEAVLLLERYIRDVDPGFRLEEALDAFGPDVRAVLGSERGNDALPIRATDYLAAQEARERLRAAFLGALGAVDALLTPTTPAPAVGLEAQREMTLDGRSVNTFQTFIRHTFCVSLAGLPAISLPAGKTEDGLPVGVQLVGRSWGDRDLLAVAHAFQILASP